MAACQLFYFTCSQAIDVLGGIARPPRGAEDNGALLKSTTPSMLIASEKQGLQQNLCSNLARTMS